ncbi:MarR family winged helix-turn-helix transcriptional regulator [Allonocardiopsis opalescens]|uniref:DNA-binding MarR family transcriptional regulator n=1 Tax=Allonocardiopsis opalescens TaxID=1144618 RepID=A0A2T0Q5B5_9ACTN|nr:MarR family winged helix-turn-helix transcriptional regulator [Allonocardiopsis opalescens]PRX98972.1 DNA-binding MarR family transcriptional regulator [Allonocardiopsis opalescens]
MSKESPDGLSVEDGVRTMLLLMPRMVGRAKRLPPPEALRSLNLAPRHLSLLAYLLFDGALGVNELAARLEVAPATVSLMVADLSRRGVVERREDDADRRRTIVSITAESRPDVEGWLAAGATAWRTALEPLSPAERRTVVDALLAYERAVGEEVGRQD